MRLNSALTETVAGLERELGATKEQVLFFFRIIGEAGIQGEEIPARLVEIAARYKLLLAQATGAPNDDSEPARLKVELRATLEKSDLEGADALLAKILGVQDREIERHASQAALTCAQRGNVAMTRLRYREAAAHFAGAAERVPVKHETERTHYLKQRDIALYLQEREFSDYPAFQLLAETWRSLMVLPRCWGVPLDWARTPTCLDNMLYLVGRWGDEEALSSTVEIYEAALLEYTRERTPLVWARTQTKLGNALFLLYTQLFLLDDRVDDEALRRAVKAYKEALLEYTLKNAPFDWAETQAHLGRALFILGAQGDYEVLCQAIEAYKAALLGYTRERAPVDWARTQESLGDALYLLGALRVDGDALSLALSAYRDAFDEFTNCNAAADLARTKRAGDRASFLFADYVVAASR